VGALAARYGVTVQAIVQANGLGNANLIRLGQRLWIPLGAAPAPTGAPPAQTPTATRTTAPQASATPGGGAWAWYTVRRGDTLSGIAARYGITWQALAQANGLSGWSIIYPGQQLRIPRD